MMLYDLLQGVIIGGAITCSALYALGRIAPNLRKRCGHWLAQSTQPRWLQYAGRKLAGAGGGCGSCDNCGPGDKKSDAAALRKIPVNHL